VSDREEVAFSEEKNVGGAWTGGDRLEKKGDLCKGERSPFLPPTTGLASGKGELRKRKMTMGFPSETHDKEGKEAGGGGGWGGGEDDGRFEERVYREDEGRDSLG